MRALLISCSGWKQRCKNWKKPVFASLFILVLLASPVIILTALAGNEVSKMNVTESKKINKNIFVGKDGLVNFFILNGETGLILVDTGNKPDGLMKVFSKFGLNAGDVKTTLLTHSDTDHVGGIAALPNTEIILSEKEEVLINGQIKRTLTPFKIPVKNQLNVNYKLIKDGGIIERDGLKIECIWSPGHTPGSSCYLINDKYLFMGDTISLKRGVADGFIKLFTMDREENIKSIRRVYDRVKDKNIEYIFTAHHGYSDDFEKVFEKFMK